MKRLLSNYRCFWFFLLAACLSGAEAPRIFYSFVFPGSGVPYLSLSLDKSGKGEFNDSPDNQDPISFQLKDDETEQIFSLAEKLDHFSRPLESGLKVANMGMKTFRFEDGEKRNEVKFNYSLDPSAQALQGWFERLAETAEHRIELERTSKYDRLGVDRALLLLQVSLERKRVVGGQMLLPVLDRIAKNSAFMNRARERAASIAEVLRGSGPKPER
jgi:hypothetical protein